MMSTNQFPPINEKQNTQFVYCGIDICKDYLDVYVQGCYHRYNFTQRGVKSMMHSLDSKYPFLRLVFESTGYLTKNLFKLLLPYQAELICLNPYRVRQYARSIGKLAKNDRIDAQTLEDFGRRLGLKQNCIPNQFNMQLQEYESALEFLIKERTAMKIRIHACDNETLIDSFKGLIENLSEKIEEINKAMKSLIESRELEKMIYESLLNVHGIGERSAKALLALLPELGHLNRAQVTSLVGVCPYNWESGMMQTVIRIKAGRKRVRSLLYLCTVSAIKSDEVLKQYYQKQLDKMKGAKVSKKRALIPCLRKLVIYLNKVVSETIEKYQNELIANK